MHFQQVQGRVLPLKYLGIGALEYDTRQKYCSSAKTQHREECENVLEQITFVNSFTSDLLNQSRRGNSFPLAHVHLKLSMLMTELTQLIFFTHFTLIFLPRQRQI